MKRYTPLPKLPSYSSMRLRAVERAEDRWRRNRSREQERVGFDPRNHRGSRA